ncbi:MAG: histidine phosphatase family protein [Chitinophagales bacterium]|nr:histidine phosphatase family protein [Chitinophagales bacterium]
MIEKELYIIRHGQTDLNAQGIVQGKGVNAPLNETGRKQADAFYNVYRHVKFDLVYTSSLLRAIQTADSFIKAGVPHIADPDLDEISWGDAEGQKNFTDHSELFNELLKEWRSGNIYYKFNGGESPFDLQQRQLRFIERLKATNEKIILIATHGRYIRALMCTLTNKPLSEMDDFDHTNLCLYKVNLLSNGTFEIEQHNNQAHLEELFNS